jgi:hypothetical protein
VVVEAAPAVPFIITQADEEPRIIQRFNGRFSAVNPAKTSTRADVAVTMVEHAVSVKKDGRTPPLPWNLVLGSGERVGNPDIDEITVERYL